MARIFNVDLMYEKLKEKGKMQKDVPEILLHMGIKTGIDTVKSWSRGDNPTNPTLERVVALAKYLDIDFTELLNIKRKTQHQANNTEVIPIPIISNIKAGAGAEGILPDFIDESETIAFAPKFLNGANPKNLRIIQVASDSMSPTIKPDEWLIFDMLFGRSIEYIDGIYLINRDGSIQVKRLEFQGTKGIDIISDNPTYAVKNTVKDSIELEIIGKLYKHVVSYGAVVEK